MFAALCLAERGMDFRVLDQGVRPASHSYALALHPRSIDLLASFGLGAADIAAGRRVDTIALYDERERRASVSLAELPGAHPYLLVLRQSRIEQLLQELLKDSHQKIGWTRRVSAVRMEGETLRVDVDQLDKISSGYAVSVPEWQVVHRESLHPSFVVGADGAESMVRRAFGIASRDVFAPAVFAVFEFASDYALGNEMRVVLGEKTTSVLWPLPDGKVRWSFGLPDVRVDDSAREKSRYAVQTEDEQEWRLDDVLLVRLLRERAPWFDAPPGEIAWSTRVKFEHRIAASFAGPRFALCGDAAHVTGPVGVHSMNLGFAEARDLVDRLARVFQDGADTRLIDEYDERWRPEWEFLLGLRDPLAPSARAGDWVAKNCARIQGCLPGGRDAIRTLAMQLGLEAKAPARAAR
jgi:2-polyprenyl-6-methoxyphenol hydroxylase-like FAD-dependent oxidoreductase